MPLEPYQFAPGRKVTDPEGDEVTIKARLLTEAGTYLVVSPDDSPYGVLIQEGYVRDEFGSVAQENDQANVSVVQPGLTTAPSNLDSRLSNLENLIGKLADRLDPSATPTPVPGTDGTEGTGSPEPPAPPAPAAPAETEAALPPGTQPAQPAPVAPAPDGPVPAPGPANLSQ